MRICEKLRSLEERLLRSLWFAILLESLKISASKRLWCEYTVVVSRGKDILYSLIFFLFFTASEAKQSCSRRGRWNTTQRRTWVGIIRKVWIIQQSLIRDVEEF